MGPELLLAAKIGGTLISTASTISNASGQADIANAKARVDNARISADIARERAQAQQEALQREQRLRTSLARQRAAFGGIVDSASGTPLRLQQVTTGSFNREQRVADFNTEQTLTNLNIQQEDVELNRISDVNAATDSAIGSGVEGAFKIGGFIENSELFGGKKN